MKTGTPVFLQTMVILWIQLILFAAVAAAAQPTRFWFMIVLLQFALLFGIVAAREHIILSFIMLCLFSVLNGILVAPAYRSMARKQIVLAAASTATVFVLMTIYAIVSLHYGFTIIGWSDYLFLALVALFLGMILNIILHTAGYHYKTFNRILAVVGIILFSLYIAYDVQFLFLKKESPVIHALNLFLDIVNRCVIPIVFYSFMLFPTR